MSQPAEIPRYARFADALLNIRSGSGMADALAASFPDITRYEVFLGCAFAMAIHNADMVAADIEVQALRAQLAAASMRRAA